MMKEKDVIDATLKELSTYHQGKLVGSVASSRRDGEPAADAMPHDPTLSALSRSSGSTSRRSPSTRVSLRPLSRSSATSQRNTTRTPSTSCTASLAHRPRAIWPGTRAQRGRPSCRVRDVSRCISTFDSWRGRYVHNKEIWRATTGATCETSGTDCSYGDGESFRATAHAALWCPAYCFTVWPVCNSQRRA